MIVSYEIYCERHNSRKVLLEISKIIKNIFHDNYFLFYIAFEDHINSIPFHFRLRFNSYLPDSILFKFLRVPYIEEVKIGNYLYDHKTLNILGGISKNHKFFKISSSVTLHYLNEEEDEDSYVVAIKSFFSFTKKINMTNSEINLCLRCLVDWHCINFNLTESDVTEIKQYYNLSNYLKILDNIIIIEDSPYKISNFHSKIKAFSSLFHLHFNRCLLSYYDEFLISNIILDYYRKRAIIHHV